VASIPRFTYHQPTELPEALALMAQYGSKARALAGGTDLIRKMKARTISVDHLISLNRIDALKSIAWDDQKGLTIGATARISQVGKHPSVLEHYPALVQACSAMATTQIRNMGTVVGNLANGSPCADTASPLLCYDAVLVVASTEGERRVPLVDFHKDSGIVDLKPGELVTSIEVPRPVDGLVSSYLRHSARSRVDIAAVSAGVAIKLDNNKQVQHVRLALGAVAPTPLRLHRAEQALLGKVLDPDTREIAVIEGMSAASPIDDIRATAEYRRAMILVLLRRALTYCQAKIERDAK
jgi:CO/xanthine dehydrogenase FAD-binding subunit